ncbi:MAG TPA: helicase-associated domain-containing protein [Candidatus Hydrogenedentes bacterium]|nr:helicase-associated domain-containing protein [Candidatus Hydrogenedentota bacterium]MDY0032965.1 helicase-associated domain-containing protein [FCB group bacterium]NLT62047.1 hypothetical protein [Candidatus Hydrogenedentota bacterium]HNZ18573.1 helicase-associated domain-containing protein [Candidatus Hydrogenedentota bacterium]HOH34018.1 helicase-associated domain-containing protein [Candidatus Hydrogenedentota bacterium]
MRHRASLVVDMEGMSRPAFHIARELSQNSRSGLTTRFLAKKLDLPVEEIEYLVDIHDRVFFTDITKVKLVTEAPDAIKRICSGLENHGDVPSLFQSIKALDAHGFRRLEEQLGIERPGGKKSAGERLLKRCYHHPDSLVEYVASRGFSPIARELFDIVWQSGDGLMPVAQLRMLHGGSEYDIEQGLWELFRGFALFELFRFDAEDRLLRAVSLLKELRQWRADAEKRRTSVSRLKPARGDVDAVDARGVELSDRLSCLVAAIAAKPVRLRGDGELFREDRRRLSEIVPEDGEPSLNVCLWAAQGVGWIARVDNELRAIDVEGLAAAGRIDRHLRLCKNLLAHSNEWASRFTIAPLLGELTVGAWYPVMGFVEHALRRNEDNDEPVLRSTGGFWHYTSPSATGSSSRWLARSLEETMLWLGLVDRAECEGESVFRLTELGAIVLGEGDAAAAKALFPARKSELVVQPNFDIVVDMQAADPLITVPLGQFCERVSASQVAVYHLTKDTFTRAVQQGGDSGAFIEFLLTHNKNVGLPRNVLTTLEDWRGGMKRVRLRTIQVLEADDPLVIADLRHRKRVAKYLNPEAPEHMAVLKKTRKSELKKLLEKEGFVVE